MEGTPSRNEPSQYSNAVRLLPGLEPVKRLRIPIAGIFSVVAVLVFGWPFIEASPGQESIQFNRAQTFLVES
jgi:hypothetical protein